MTEVQQWGQVRECREDECVQTIRMGLQPNGRWAPFNLDGSEHWLTCRAPATRQRRIRAGKEPGFFPCSHTAVNAYRECPLYWHVFFDPRNPDREPEPKSPAAELGSAFHDYAAALILGKEPPPVVVPLEYARDWGYVTRDLQRQIDEGLWGRQGASTEEELLYEWRDGEVTVQFKGKIDYWRYRRQEAPVTDFKSGWMVASESSITKDPQGKNYAMLVMRNYPKVESVLFQQVQHRYGGHIVPAIFDQMTIAEHEEVLRGIVHRMHTDTEWRPNPYCSRCPPGLHPTAKYNLRVQNAEEARCLAEATHRTEVDVAAAKAVLNKWTKENGPALGYGHYATTSPIVVDVEGAIKILRAHVPDAPPGEQKDQDRVEARRSALMQRYIRFDGAGLRSILNGKRTQGLAAELEPVLSQKVKPKFEWRASPDDAGEEPVDAELEGGDLDDAAVLQLPGIAAKV